MEIGAAWVRITRVTLYYREKGGSRFLDAFPVRIGNKHIDDCHDEDGEDGLMSPTILIHTSTSREEIEEWATQWRDQADKTSEQWRKMLFQGHSLCCRLERALEEYYEYSNRNFIVRLQERPLYRLKLMNEYSVDWPIWTCDIGKADYQQFLSPHLKDRLVAWAANFNSNFHTCLFQKDGWEGWKTKDEEQRHWVEGRELELAPQEQLSAGDSCVDWDVYLSLWEK